MRKLLLFFAMTLAVQGFMFRGLISAQSSGERISSFISSVDLDISGSATITETIEYQFGDIQRRGIFRDIPTQYLVSGDQGYVLGVSIIEVLRNGSKEPYEQLNEDPDFTRIKIGDPDFFISDKHVYTVIYVITPVVIDADDGTQIVRLDVPGSGWEVPVDDVKVSISTSQFEPVSTTCYEGIVGSTDQTCEQKIPVIYSPSKTVQPGETLTIEAVYEAGTFSDTAELATLDTGEVSTTVVVGALSVVGGLFGLFAVNPLLGYFRYKQRRKQENSYPRYEPPKDMGPAEMGLLVDNSSNGAELSATLIQLAVQGYMKIEQTKDKKWYRQAEFTFHKQSGTAPLKPYQQEIYDALFATFKNPSIHTVISAIYSANKNKNEDLETQEAALKDEIIEDKKSITSKELIASQTFRRVNKSFHSTLKKNLKDLGFYKKVSIFSPTLAQRMSDEGYAKWAEVEGFREFLSLTEANRMAMLEAPDRKPEQFSDLLPYAVALGVEKQWAKQFKNLDVKVDDWYQGSGGNLSTAYLASSLSSGLGGVATAANASSGSAGGGGGFSGGGFSGGGGGSW